MGDDKKTPEISDEMKELLDDEQIRKFFQSMDPNRPKTNPFLTDEAEESVRGKASGLTLKQPEAKEEKVYGIADTQHTKHIRDVARHFSLIGSAVALTIAIILSILL